MNTLREIALSFCAAAVMTGAIGLLAGDRLQMSMKYIISLSLICSVLSVAVKGDFSFDLTFTSAQTQEISTDPLYEYQAEYIIGEILKSAGITYQNITANATKNEDGSIVINEIEITGCSDSQKAKEKVMNQGIDCVIKVK